MGWSAVESEPSDAVKVTELAPACVKSGVQLNTISRQARSDVRGACHRISQGIVIASGGAKAERQ